MRVASFSLEGKVAIVTGASRGIGRSIAMGLAEHGADVAIAARTHEPLEKTASEISAFGHRTIAVPTNVRKSDQLLALVAETERQLGRVDILVNNAGTSPVNGPIQEVDPGAWDVLMNTNVKSAHLLGNYAREAILRHGEGGSIVNVSSVRGRLASTVIGGYAVSKAALIMLTQVQAKTWGADGIRVNCIAPGLVETDFARAIWENPQTRNATERETALGRIGVPDEMAGAVVYLASPASAFVTGQTLVIDGGRLL